MAKRYDTGKHVPGKGDDSPLPDDAGMRPRFGNLQGGFTKERLFEYYNQIDLDQPEWELTAREAMCIRMVERYEWDEMFRPTSQLTNDEERARHLIDMLGMYIDATKYSDAYVIFMRMLDKHVLVSVSEERVVLLDRWQEPFVNYLVWACSPRMKKRLELDSTACRNMAKYLTRILWIGRSSNEARPTIIDSLNSEISKAASPDKKRHVAKLSDKLDRMSGHRK